MVKCNENAIREAAYYIWQNAGCPQGQEDWCWSAATEQLCNCKSSSNSSCKTNASASTAKKTTASKSAACKSTSTAKKSAK